MVGGRVPLWRCYSLPFAANVSSAASPQQLTSVCVLLFFSRDPSCPGRFYFIFEKEESLHRAWVTSSRPVQPQIFASGALLLAQGGGTLLCAVALAAGPAEELAEEKKAVTSVWPLICKTLLDSHVGKNDSQPRWVLPMPGLFRARIHYFLQIAVHLLTSPPPPYTQSQEGQSDWTMWTSKAGLSQDSSWPEQALGFRQPVANICLPGKT